MAALREIIASFGVDFDKEGNLAKGDKRVDSLTDKLASFGKGVIAAFAVDRIVSFGREVLNDADAVAKQAQALGVSAAALQGWQHAASLSGSSAEELNGALTKFTRNVNEAGESAGGPAAQAFKALGVQVKDASGKLGAPIELLDGVVAGLEGIQDPAKRTAVVMDLFGRSGAKLLPLFSEGTEGIKKLRAEVSELGTAYDEAFLENAQEFNDNTDRLRLGLKGLFVQAIGPLLPGLVKLTQTLVTGAKGFIAWIKNGKVLQTALAVLAGNGIYKLVTSVPELIKTFGKLAPILGRVAMFAARVVLPFLILDDIIGFLSGDDSALGAGLNAIFGEGTAKMVQDLVASVTEFFGLFKSEPNKARAEFQKFADSTEWGNDPFMRGWNEGLLELGLFMTNALTGGWQNFVNKAKAAGDGFMLALKIIWTEVKFAGLGAAAAMSDAFDGVWNSIISGAQAALSALLDVLEKLPGMTDAVKAGRAKVKSLDGARGDGKAGEFVDQQRYKERLAIAAEGDRIGAVATAPALGASSTTNSNNTTNAPINTSVTVNVQGGAEVANRVGKATGKAVEAVNMRAVKTALVPTPR